MSGPLACQMSDRSEISNEKPSVVLVGPAGHARRCHRRTVNSGRPKYWDVDCVSGVAEGNSLQAGARAGRVHADAELGCPVIKWDGLQAGEYWSGSLGDEKVVKCRHRLLLLLKKYTRIVSQCRDVSGSRRTRS